jgi:hypothetical protein
MQLYNITQTMFSIESLKHTQNLCIFVKMAKSCPTYTSYDKSEQAMQYINKTEELKHELTCAELGKSLELPLSSW